MKAIEIMLLSRIFPQLKLHSKETTHKQRCLSCHISQLVNDTDGTVDEQFFHRNATHTVELDLCCTLQMNWKCFTTTHRENATENSMIAICTELLYMSGRNQVSRIQMVFLCTSKPCSLPRFIMSLQSFGTWDIRSTAFCKRGLKCR